MVTEIPEHWQVWADATRRESSTPRENSGKARPYRDRAGAGPGTVRPVRQGFSAVHRVEASMPQSPRADAWQQAGSLEGRVGPHQLGCPPRLGVADGRHVDLISAGRRGNRTLGTRGWCTPGAAEMVGSLRHCGRSPRHSPVLRVHRGSRGRAGAGHAHAPTAVAARTE